MISYDPKKTETLKLSFNIGALFFSKISASNKKSQLLYGFYEKHKDSDIGEEYFLYEETLIALAKN